MWRELLGLDRKAENLIEIITPQRTFNDVVLPDDTRRQLYEALTQVEKHRLIFTDWGLGERHPTGLGLAFNFAGPPGTGKSICAEAIAYALGKKLMRIRYAELESMWVGETGKNLHAVFREAARNDLVVFFDEADSVAARRFTNVQAGHEREANQSVNILLKELEDFRGVVIFATNMASNFDPAFERRVRTHVLFRAPGPQERERIWQVQIHPAKTPLGADVDFRVLAERFEATGGDIRNAVLKAALMAAAEDGPDETKRILQGHFIAGMEQVLASRMVMQQNAVGSEATHPMLLAAGIDSLDGRLEGVELRLDQVEERLSGAELAQRQERDALAAEIERGDAAVRAHFERALTEAAGEQERGLATVRGELETERARIRKMTLIPLQPITSGLVLFLIAALAVVSGYFLPHP